MDKTMYDSLPDGESRIGCSGIAMSGMLFSAL